MTACESCNYERGKDCPSERDWRFKGKPIRVCGEIKPITRAQLAEAQAKIETAKSALVEQIKEHQITEEMGGIVARLEQERDAMRAEIARLKDGAVGTISYPGICEDDIDEMWKTCENCEDPARAMAVEGYRLATDHVPVGTAIKLVPLQDGVVSRKEGVRLLDAIEEMQIAYATGSEELVHRKAQSVVLYRHALDALRAHPPAGTGGEG
jgi:hypothetical protein